MARKLFRKRSTSSSVACANVQRGEGLTAWRQIADGVAADVLGGRLAAGEKLPTEAALAARFGVHRHTVRRALAALAERGLVRTSQGSGTFVEASPLAYPIGRRTRFSEIVAKAGREAWGDLISARRVAASSETARALQLSAGAPLLELTTLHKASGTPISLAHTLLPLPRFEGFAETYARKGSLTRAYRAFAVDDYERISTRITAGLAGVEEASLLGTAPGRLLLVVNSINVDQSGQRIQATRSHFVADRVEFVIEHDQEGHHDG